ncbi:M16 family metallopeptidase [Phytohabitans suffuscus]|uniref:Zinc protease n=1 Tax=Phytohabitans suffuscus TaxID=624315 RepID=A0A6F8YA38_9ACTN|nr:pitrilysin family protein [Phytohabitans suffuscus]BCB82893.1 zinc protease [Phytohabitans suffuscus]
MTGLDRTAVTLRNGVRVVYARDTAMPVAAVHVRVEVGSRDERPGRSGFAHLFEHLMFAATAGMDGGDHVRAIETAGGFTNANTLVESTSYFQTVPGPAAPLAVWLEARRLARLPEGIDAGILDREREVVRNEWRDAVLNTPYGDAREAVTAAMYPPPHPFSRTPTGEIGDLDAATVDGARDFFADHYVPGRVLVAVAGRFDRALVEDEVERGFGGLRADRGGGPRPAAGGADIPDEPVRLDRRSAAPPNLVVAHRLPPARGVTFAAADVTAAVLATGQASRLQRRLRSDTALAANIQIKLLPMIAGDSMAIVRLRPAAGVDTARLESAYLDQLVALAMDGPFDQELERAKSQRLAAWLADVERPRMLAEDLTWDWAARGEARPPGESIRRVLAVTAADVRECAAALLRRRRVTLTYHST